MKKIGVRISQLMNANPVTVDLDMTLPECARKMLARNVGSVIVKDKGHLVGIVTEKDIVEEAVGKELNIKKTKVKDIMTTGMVQISPDSDLAEAVALMIREDVRRLPVVKDGKLLGLVTVKDILNIQPKLYQTVYECLILKKTKR